MFSKLGARIIDLDKLARRVTERGARAYDDIVEHFGDAILDARGCINREKLGSLVFSDKKARKKLEEITHPKIGEELFKEIQKLRESGEKCVLVEAPLLIEAGMHHWLKPFIVVTAKRENQISRLQKKKRPHQKGSLK
jgi:dephospho-CoA kinase